MGPPETTTWEYPGPDDSWALELEEFLADIAQQREPAASLADARAALAVVERIYLNSATERT
jgi:predicted dehydrogenase